MKVSIDRFAGELRHGVRLPKLVGEAKSGRGNASQIGSLQVGCIGCWGIRRRRRAGGWRSRKCHNDHQQGQGHDGKAGS